MSSPKSASEETVSGPKKYVKDREGISRINPAWRGTRASIRRKTTLTKEEEEKALPFFTTQEEYYQNLLTPAEDGSGTSTGLPCLAESTLESIGVMKDENVAKMIGLPVSSIMNDIGVVFEKYEIPMGLLNKMLNLKDFDALHFVVDDSEKMNHQSDSKTDGGEFMTRWEETRVRLIEMMEILAYIPTPPVMISFLNRPIQIAVSHETGANPVSYHAFCSTQINMIFDDKPSGSTPYAKRMKQLFETAGDKKVAWYFFGDGVPDGGDEARAEIENMIVNRPSPQQTPITFFSCTNETKDVEWMKDLEELAAFCSEYDDYETEKQEVLGDQGFGLPFTRGFYLVGSLVAAMNPDDLDAMDESVPFTKYALDNLLGIKSDDNDYKSYFKQFMIAQKSRQESAVAGDVLKKTMDWEPFYQDFATTKSPNEIEAVRGFKKNLLSHHISIKVRYDDVSSQGEIQKTFKEQSKEVINSSKPQQSNANSSKPKEQNQDRQAQKGSKKPAPAVVGNSKKTFLWACW